MKTLLITSLTKKSPIGQSFGIIDPETKEILYRHFCSHSGYAFNDLYTNSRKEELTLKYGEHKIEEQYQNDFYIP